MKRAFYLLTVMTACLSTTGFGGYVFDFVPDWSLGTGPTSVQVYDSTSGDFIAEWNQLAGDIGPYLDISAFTGDVPNSFEFLLICDNGPSTAVFDTSDLIISDDYIGYWDLEAPNILVIGGIYNLVSPPTSQELFSGLHAVPEPTTLMLLGVGGLMLRKRK